MDFLMPFLMPPRHRYTCSYLHNETEGDINVCVEDGHAIHSCAIKPAGHERITGWIDVKRLIIEGNGQKAVFGSFNSVMKGSIRGRSERLFFKPAIHANLVHDFYIGKRADGSFNLYFQNAMNRTIEIAPLVRPISPAK